MRWWGIPSPCNLPNFLEGLWVYDGRKKTDSKTCMMKETYPVGEQRERSSQSFKLDILN